MHVLKLHIYLLKIISGNKLKSSVNVVDNHTTPPVHYPGTGGTSRYSILLMPDARQVIKFQNLKSYDKLGVRALNLPLWRRTPFFLYQTPNLPLWRRTLYHWATVAVKKRWYTDKHIPRCCYRIMHILMRMIRSGFDISWYIFD